MGTVHKLADYRPPPTDTPTWAKIVAHGAVQSMIKTLDRYEGLSALELQAFAEDMQADVEALLLEVVECGLGRSIAR